jgi:CubicO group peptidase (beta-lactamase class C family)
MTTSIEGVCPPQFAAVRDAFQKNFDEDLELGAAFALCVDGELAVDIWAGSADRAGTRPWTEDTLAPVFSLTKAVGAVMCALAVERGRLEYEQTVASLWPEFAQAGKGEITVGQALSHQAGLSGFAEPIDPELWFDWDAVCARVAAAAPLWPPASASGYGPALWGFVAGEIFRRADGRTLGRALAEDLAGPFDLDIWIGLPPSEDARMAELRKPTTAPDFGEINAPTKAAFLQPWSSPRANVEQWRRVENPAVNGMLTARSAAKLLSALACEGRLDGRSLLSPATIEAATRERIFGQDLVLPFTLSWAAGFTRNRGLDFYGPNPNAVSHAGWGGSCGWADPQARVSGCYVMNRQSHHLIGDPRPLRIIESAYAAL